MSCCARCGQGICSTAGKIALNKVWHKGCFCCYNCNRALQINNAKIYYGEVFCSCCCPQLEEVYPLKVCRVNSTPSFSPVCSTRVMQAVCCNSTDSECRPRDVHSCSCIPACCTPQTTSCCCRNTDDPCNSCDPCFKRIHCVPRSPKPVNYPPRQRRCLCPKCCPKTPKRKPCPEPCYVIKRKPPCSPPPCCEGKKKIYVQACGPPICGNPCNKPQMCSSPCNKLQICGSPCNKPPICSPCNKPPNCNPCVKPCNNSCCCKYCCVERCKRCGEKVFAAEKVLTSHGSYHLGCFTCYCCCKSLCVKSMYEACGEIYCRQCYNNYFGVSGYGYCC